MPPWASQESFTRAELQWSTYIADGLWVLAGTLFADLAVWSMEPNWTA